MTEFKEQFRLTLSNEGKIRNRCEAQMVKLAQAMLAGPVALSIEQVKYKLDAALARTKEVHPSWGTCRISDVSVASTITGKSHWVTRHFAIYGRGRGIYTLLISETVRKDADNNYEPLQPLRS